MTENQSNVQLQIDQNGKRYYENLYHKSDLQRLVETKNNQRTKHILKAIRNQLKEMNCFRSLLQENSQKDSVQIIKRDNQILTNVIAMYARPNYAIKGSVIEATGNHRDSIKILLRGNVGVFQPLGNKSYKYCYQKYLKHQLKFQQLNQTVNAILQNQHQHQNQQTLKNKQQNYITQQNIAQKLFLQSDKTSTIERQTKIMDILKNRHVHIHIHDNHHHSFNINNNKYSNDDKNQENIKINLKELKQMLLQQNKLTQKQGLKLLYWANIHSAISPHKLTKIIQKWGQIISSSKNPHITKQGDKHQVTMACLSDCAYLQIDFSIFKQILVFFNNDEEKPYIRALLRKFQNMQYYQAKRYVKRFTMIDKNKMYKIQNYQTAVKQIYGEKVKNVQNQPNFTEQLTQNDLFPFVKTTLKRKVTNIMLEEDEKLSNKFIQKKQQQKFENQKKILIQEQFRQNQQQQKQQSQQDEKIHTEEDLNKKNVDFLHEDTANTTYQISYSNQVYLIVEGEVTFIIDQISAYRVSQTCNAVLKKSVLPKHLLKLYSGDMFGFQSIGQQKQYRLRYQIKINSKVLKMSTQIMQQHFKYVQNFQKQIKFIKQQRQILLKTLTQRIQNNIQQNLIKKYIFRQDFRIAKDIKVNHHKQIYQDQSRITKITATSKQTILKSSFQQHQKSKRKQILEHTHANIQPIRQIFKLKKSEIRQIQYIGAKSFEKLQQRLAFKLTKQKMVKSNRKITLDLLKQFDLGVKFVSEIEQNEGIPVMKKFIQMRDENGNLLRKKSIPLIGSKKEIQKIVMRKIGIMNQQEVVRHNMKVAKSRKSKNQLDDQKKQRKQFNRLSRISKSLPKLDKFYAKSQNLLFNTISSRMNLIY